MDRLSIVVSLLLILSVTTTFGSVIKAKNPTKEEPEELRSDPDSSPYHKMPRNSKGLEALLKRSHGPKSLRDQDSEMPKFKDDPEEAVVIPGHELTPARLEDFLDSLPSASRVVAMGIDNESGSAWSKFPPYFVSGTQDKPLPYHLPNESAVLYGALSTGGNIDAIGVVTYYIPSIRKTLGVMWSVRFFQPNTWNIRLYDGEETANSDMYQDLRDHGAMGPGEKSDMLGSGFKFTGELSSNGAQVTLEIHVKSNIVSFSGKPASMHN